MVSLNNPEQHIPTPEEEQKSALEGSQAELTGLNDAIQSQLDRPEALLRDAVMKKTQEALASLVKNAEAQQTPLTAEDHADILANQSLGQEWNDKRNDGFLARREVDKSLTGKPLLSGQQSVEPTLANTEKEIQKRGFGFERSRFNNPDFLA